MKYLLSFLLYAFVVSVSAQDTTTGLIAHYPLNGSATDQVNLGTGTLQGNPQYGPDQNGNASGAMVFDGEYDYIQLDNASILNLGESFTIAAWVRLDALNNGDMRILSTLDVQQGAQTKGYSFGIQKDNSYGRNPASLSLYLGNVLWQWDIWTSPANSIQAQNWMHVAVTVENTSTVNKTVTFYVNGVSQASTLWNSPENTTNWSTDVNSIRIGDAHAPGNNGYFTNSAMFEGSISDLRIYGRSLTTTDIAELHSPTVAEPTADAESEEGMFVDIYDDVMYVPGKVGIGNRAPDAELAVSGKIHAERVKVDLTVPGPDYVFEPDYNLLPLEEINRYIKEHKHLPEVPSAKEMEKAGIHLGEMSMLLLKKVEELTLHQIKLMEKVQQLEKQNLELQKKLQQLDSKSGK